MNLPDPATFPRTWAYNLRRRYRLRVDDWLLLWAYQGGACFLCRRSAADCPKDREALATGFVVEHNHSTGSVRGLTCSPCNLLVGGLERLPAAYRAAVATPHLLGYLACPPARVLGVGQREG